MGNKFKKFNNNKASTTIARLIEIITEWGDNPIDVLQPLTNNVQSFTSAKDYVHQTVTKGYGLNGASSELLKLALDEMDKTELAGIFYTYDVDVIGLIWQICASVEEEEEEEDHD